VGSPVTALVVRVVDGMVGEGHKEVLEVAGKPSAVNAFKIVRNTPPMPGWSATRVVFEPGRLT